MVSTRHRYVGVVVAIASLAVVSAGCGNDRAAPNRSTTTQGTTPPPPANGEIATDAAALQAAATEFDAVSSELKSSIGAVDSDAGELTSQLQGPAGASAQAAFARFQEAATKQINQLNDIGGDVARAGVQYEPPAGGSGALVTGDPALVINGQIATIQGLLDQGGQAVRKLAAVWGGSGSDAYQVVQQRWDANADELNAALQDLSTKISDAGSATQ